MQTKDVTRRGPTLHRAWTTTLAQLLIVIATLGIVAYVVTQNQRASFSSTTGDVQEEMTAELEVERAFLATQTAMGQVLYRTQGAAKTSEAMASYVAGRPEVIESFEQAIQVASPDVREHAEAAYDAWREADAGIRGSGAVTDAELLAALAAGEDPYIETVTEPAAEFYRNLTEMRRHSLENVEVRTAHVERVQRVIGPAIIGVVVLALLLAWLAARRMSRLVLRPLAELGRATQRIAGNELDQPVEVDDAIAEVQDLAEVLNATAASLRESHGRLRSQALTDSLTGLANRKAFVEGLAARLDNGREERTAILFIDLDDFKVVNDSQGHAAGDALLRIVARRLESATRDGELVARLGGDEFAVALGCDHVNDAVVVAERVLEALGKPASIEGVTAPLRCSIGVAVGAVGAGVDSADELLRNADFAMYMAKSQGKHCIEVHSASMHNEMLSRMELRRELSQAVRLEQLALHYQPVLDLDTSTVIGFEALVRWDHPTRGLLPPGEFIAMAEDTGAIVEIGAWVIDAACAELALLRSQPASAGAWMSVNVSPLQLDGPAIVSTVLSAIERHGIPADSLILEITEAAAMTNTVMAIELLNELRAAGVHVALDDFGTGFASLRNLGDLPVDVVKIDRSFVIGEGQDDESMLDAMIAIAGALGMKVIAEGIEEQSHLDKLRRYDDISGQGYLFAKPMSAADTEVYVESLGDPSPGMVAAS
ncbi:MAG TPA: EAL domain-containing protein [Acidimicrobiales bacterium]|nr:EAL domain-containing protein [Acidimicrobiales bacterium]